MPAIDSFPPTRTEALNRLRSFVPHAGKDYAALRNHDLGPGRHRHVSTLSPYVRHRLITEDEVLQAVLGRHSRNSADKFIQEVFWRTYFKGWLEMRPGVWDSYRKATLRLMDDIATQSGLRHRWEAACKGETGIECFDAWARELVETGYLHNHARMWFASIWIFTLRLPWELGADFFLRHLLDGDPASNTLSWRWVGGLHTRGKTYLARPSNIAKYTDGRFSPAAGELASEAPPVDGPDNPARMAPPTGDRFDPTRPTVLLLHEDDLAPGWLFDLGLNPLGTARLDVSARLSPLEPAPHVAAFKSAAMDDVCARWSNKLGPVKALSDPAAMTGWARSLGAEQIVTSYAPIGPVAEALRAVDGMPVVQPLRPFDANAWPSATHGFFKFRERIPHLLGTLHGLRAA
ncbi:DNA photolyase [Thalassococcus sp. CAU 1522]|uniref:DNA photolyase n=1 Tax=Thalassococcus arenae TaxID=2851652 RepID=A0ABS6N9I4_9RHOB|nr:FAD-binding domain-containing protein [Thalassococcus arenae]MBV2360347.1 DNA photolyase [Thalassococcus arenae]